MGGSGAPDSVRPNGEHVADIRAAIERLEKILVFYYYEEEFWHSVGERWPCWVAARRADALGLEINNLRRMLKRTK